MCPDLEPALHAERRPLRRPQGPVGLALGEGRLRPRPLRVRDPGAVVPRLRRRAGERRARSPPTSAPSTCKTPFYTAKVPAAQLAAVDAEIAHLKTQVPAMEKMKFRSSANAEDIPNFDGAGLHDSFSVKRRRDQAQDQAEDPAVRHQGRAREPVEHARHRGAILRAPRSRDGEHGYRDRAEVRRGEPGGRERCDHHALRQQRAAREQPRHEPRSRHHLANDTRHLQRRRPPYPLHPRRRSAEAHRSSGRTLLASSW